MPEQATVDEVKQSLNEISLNITSLKKIIKTIKHFKPYKALGDYTIPFKHLKMLPNKIIELSK